MIKRLMKKITSSDVIDPPTVLGLFKNAQVQGAQKTELRGVYEYTLSGTICSATQQMSVFQQPHYMKLSGSTSAVTLT